jgi:hypothetical protein
LSGEICDEYGESEFRVWDSWEKHILYYLLSILAW